MCGRSGLADKSCVDSLLCVPQPRDTTVRPNRQYRPRTTRGTHPCGVIPGTEFYVGVHLQPPKPNPIHVYSSLTNAVVPTHALQKVSSLLRFIHSCRSTNAAYRNLPCNVFIVYVYLHFQGLNFILSFRIVI
ncbi:hypothetical protein PanWU01x14_245450 [Parasponia andersonii]|uniref:Uncharacterized protein n=1 Tax=Parasponia andersonii TaxID=3476 RepID=A0A2P5BEW6_PARAD|nr:hypothetical protein PanWU01x14_245450 [Parasponia andersonii]